MMRTVYSLKTTPAVAVLVLWTPKILLFVFSHELSRTGSLQVFLGLGFCACHFNSYCQMSNPRLLYSGY
jgi:hypothetical protein